MLIKMPVSLGPGACPGTSQEILLLSSYTLACMQILSKLLDHTELKNFYYACHELYPTESQLQ